MDLLKRNTGKQEHWTYKMLFFVLKSKGESTKSFNLEMKKSQKGRKRYSNISIGIFQNLPPGGSVGKEPTCQSRRPRDTDSISGSARSPGEGNVNSFPSADILVWKIPWSKEPGGLQSMGSQSWAGVISCASAHTH